MLNVGTLCTNMNSMVDVSYMHSLHIIVFEILMRFFVGCSMGNGLDTAAAVQFWRAAFTEAEKVVKEHAKALQAAEKPGCVLYTLLVHH